MASEMHVVFASLNIGLPRSQACGQNAERKLKAIARGVQQALRTRFLNKAYTNIKQKVNTKYKKYGAEGASG